MNEKLLTGMYRIKPNQNHELMRTYSARLSLCLHLHSNFVYVSDEEAGESENFFTDPSLVNNVISTKHENLMCRLM